jgi:hypothetical protein
MRPLKGVPPETHAARIERNPRQHITLPVLTDEIAVKAVGITRQVGGRLSTRRRGRRAEQRLIAPGWRAAARRTKTYTDGHSLWPLV